MNFIEGAAARCWTQKPPKCCVRLKPVLSVLCQKFPVQRGNRSLKFTRLIRRKDTLFRRNIEHGLKMGRKEHGVCVEKHSDLCESKGACGKSLLVEV